MSALPAQPLVSIGMPVYNAEQYLRKALRALLAQDYPHFELIISDNGSRDRTEEICRKFQTADARIRYIRQPENQGAAWNFAFAVQEARGEYFMWAAHDDLWAPSYVRKCLAKLESHPEAVLCCTEINFIGGDGLPHPGWSKKNYKNIETLGMTPAQRIHELFNRMGWFAIYGLMRLETTKKLPLGLSVYGVDVIMLMELLLLGDFVKVHEPLFTYRILKTKSSEDYQAEFNSEKNPAPATQTPYTDLAANLLQTANRSGLSPREKLEIFADLVITLSRWNLYWRHEITNELFGQGVTVNDSQFALLLSVVLSRSFLIEEVQGNPLIKAICLLPDGGPDLLEVAERLRSQPGATMPAPHDETYKEGARLYSQGRFEEASNLFREALQQQESSDRWNDWATARLACNHVAEAEQGFRRALELDVNHGQAAVKLGILMAKFGRNRDAVFYLEHGMAGINEPERAAVLQLLSNCRTQLAAATGA